MIYKRFGKTDIQISRLGMGCMRLPLSDPADMKKIDMEHTELMFEELMDGGVNYFDTAYPYHGGESENVMGKLLEPYRKDIILSTKAPGWVYKEPGDFRRVFDEQLEKLRTDYLDIYYLHGINEKEYKELDDKFGWIKKFAALKEEGLVRHLCYSFHGPTEDLATLAEVDIFEAVLCQYSLLDMSNAESMKKVKERDLGIAVMGPVAGGRITEFGPSVLEQLNISAEERARFALQFVWSNPDVDCALSGMSSIEQVRENLLWASKTAELNNDEIDSAVQVMTELKKKGEIRCTGCKYCMPCPQEVNIPLILKFQIYHDVYEMQNFAREKYDRIGKDPWYPGKPASACTECGECEDKCPQDISIVERLAECRKLFEEKNAS